MDVFDCINKLNMETYNHCAVLLLSKSLQPYLVSSLASHCSFNKLYKLIPHHNSAQNHRRRINRVYP